MGSIVFLPSVKSTNMPKLYSKMTRLYSFKIRAFQLYWPSEAGLHQIAASLGRRTHDFRKITRKIRLYFISISPGGRLGGANDQQCADLHRARRAAILRRWPEVRLGGHA